MTSGEIFTAQIESIASGGAGFARLEGKSVFTELTAPGDIVKCRITKNKKYWAEAELLEVLEASPLRKEAECRYYGVCGGCSLQHLDYDAQIKAKTDILHNAFRRIGGMEANLIPEIKIHRSAPFEYRNRLGFHIMDGKPAFRKRKSHQLVVIDDCPVADTAIRKALADGKLNQSQNKDRFSVYSRGNTFLAEGSQEKGRVLILDRELSIDVKLFFQSNAAMLELLIEDLKIIAEKADKNLPLADIYCGGGTFASFLSGDCSGLNDSKGKTPDQKKQWSGEIDLVEENKAALALAVENIPPGFKVNYNALTDTEWVKLMDNEKKKSWGFMVLDPPRDGMSSHFSKWLASQGPELLAYVSCDPATLARDSRCLLEGGYKLQALNFYDFYPQTAHIESLAVFRKEREIMRNEKLEIRNYR